MISGYAYVMIANDSLKQHGGKNWHFEVEVTMCNVLCMGKNHISQDFVDAFWMNWIGVMMRKTQ